MKVKVKDLVANPYRNITKYPIDRAKVDALKTSIKETTFWDNILVRKADNGKFQIAYGHHRHIALKELKLQEVDIPCRKLSDAQMVKIMAEENLQWMTSPAVINETVLATKKFLDAELAKCKTWKEFRSDRFIRPIIQTEPEFRSIKGKGIGRETILKFLGGNWKAWMIEAALATIKSDKMPVEKGGVDRNAVETLPTIEAANKFRNEIKKHRIPKPIQRRIAKKIVDDGIGARDIPDTIREIAKPEHLDRVKKKVMPTLDKYVENTINHIQNVHLELVKIKPNMDCIQSQSTRNQLLRECDKLLKVIGEMKIKEKSNAKKTG